ncbi:MAG: sigma-54-dependent Fis family transcriptional regulator [Deltaproteobacteria bacterium]|nr:sigma-54-dependent Fis family transcriptional regulator [Deltaproteobacteria bacterium]
MAGSKGRVLVVDDEVNLRKVLTAILEQDGHIVEQAGNGIEALKLLDAFKPEVVITDLKMPKLSGMDLLRELKKRSPGTQVFLITAYGTKDTAVAALKAGAMDYITKPFEQDEILELVAKALRRKRLGDSNDSDASLGERLGMLGRTPAMLEIFELINRVADTDSTVLITGESGTGKDLVARALHDNSSRKGGPFVHINCAAIPKELVESELFGYERGAFTGAVMSKPGRFEIADKGTLFLDEIAEIPVSIQVKLLKVLQQSEFERVGGTKSLKTDVRVLAATNRDLEKEIASGAFREDLYYRLAVVPIQLPPLRERRDDIPLMVRYMAEKFAKKHARQVPAVDDEFVELVKSYNWPGNVRELENVLEKMILEHSPARLTVGLLPPEFTGIINRDLKPDQHAGTGTLKDVVRAETRKIEMDLITRTLSETGGNVTRAAKLLGLSRKGLQLKMKDLGISRDNKT